MQSIQEPSHATMTKKKEKKSEPCNHARIMQSCNNYLNGDLIGLRHVKVGQGVPSESKWA